MKFKRLWEETYKRADDLMRLSRSPELPEQRSYLESILDQVAPTAGSTSCASLRQDQLAQYIAEGPVLNMGLLEYWRLRETHWP
jgi:hypothetical protein